MHHRTIPKWPEKLYGLFLHLWVSFSKERQRTSTLQKHGLRCSEVEKCWPNQTLLWSIRITSSSLFSLRGESSSWGETSSHHATIWLLWSKSCSATPSSAKRKTWSYLHSHVHPSYFWMRWWQAIHFQNQNWVCLDPFHTESIRGVLVDKNPPASWNLASKLCPKEYFNGSGQS